MRSPGRRECGVADPEVVLMAPRGCDLGAEEVDGLGAGTAQLVTTVDQHPEHQSGHRDERPQHVPDLFGGIATGRDLTSGSATMPQAALLVSAPVLSGAP